MDMAKRYENFTQPYEHSKIPFLLVEVVTNGRGEMVDLICRFSNPAAAELLGLSPAALRNQRFCQTVSPERLAQLAPLCQVAFSGSSASFSYETVTGRRLQIICYQLMYGLCACLLEDSAPRAAGGRSAAEMLTDCLPGGTAVVELGRGGVRALSMSRQIGDLTGYAYRDLLNQFSGHLPLLIFPEDRAGLLQCLMDAVDSGQGVRHEFRLLQKNGEPLWVSMQAEQVSSAGAGPAVFQLVVFSIDSQRRSEEQLRSAQRRLTDTQAQLDELLDGIPGGCCLLRLPAAGKTAELIRVGRSLADTLGFSRPELLKRLRASSWDWIHPDDREAFPAARDAFLSGRRPQRSVFRFQSRDGSYRALALSSLTQAQADGSIWICLVATDVTRERDAQEKLDFYAELNRLLLEQSGTVSIDYSPAADTARFESFGAGGQRLTHTVSGYRASLPDSSTIHPDFRKIVGEKFRSACEKPQKGTYSYLGKYAGQDYRWYQASYVSLADRQGNVSRVIIELRDISEQETAVTRFRDQMAHWETAAGKSLCSIRLDLSDNKPLDAHGGNAYLLQVMFGNSADECLSGLCRNIPEEDGRQRFDSLFSRKSLLRAFRRGVAHLELEHRFLSGPKTAVWVHATGELMKNPDTRHVEASLFLLDTDFAKRRSIVLSCLAERTFLLIMTIDPASGRFCRYDACRDGEAKYGDFDEAARQLIGERVPAEDRDRLRSAASLRNLIRCLGESDPYTIVFPLRLESGLCRMQFRCSWLNPEKATLLLTALPAAEQTELPGSESDA